MRRAVERRRAERNEMIESARGYFRIKAAEISIHAAYLVGSVARGDFNLWSDVDVVIVADAPPPRFLDRIDLFSDRPPGVEVFPYTPEELKMEQERKNPIVLEAGDIGIDLLAGAAG
jgi:Predicted nucleotidyltransferase